MDKHTSKHTHTSTVGIIGDGQLGMLLCEAARTLPVSTVMLTSDASCAAAQRADECVEGAMDDAAALATLIERCDVITYEREDVPPAAVTSLRAAEAAGQVRCFPSLSVIEMIQDKALQKRWLASRDLATLPFVITDGARATLDRAATELGLPLVQKALRGGFDGRGVQLLRDATSLDAAWPGETLLEKYAGQFREIAVLVVRGSDGVLAHFGPVDMSFETDYSVLDTVTAPACISDAATQKAVELAKSAVTAMDGVGVFGVEMFLLDDGDIFINEISPRVHNAGHYTLDACATSQFEQHLRAVCGMPLGSVELESPAAMRNILCTKALEQEGKTHGACADANSDGSVTYWYGKSPARLMRKLGHVTATAATAEDALAIAMARWTKIQQEAANEADAS